MWTWERGMKSRKIKIKENTEEGFSLLKEILPMTTFSPFKGKEGCRPLSQPLISSIAFNRTRWKENIKKYWGGVILEAFCLGSTPPLRNLTGTDPQSYQAELETPQTGPESPQTPEGLTNSHIKGSSKCPSPHSFFSKPTSAWVVNTTD